MDEKKVEVAKEVKETPVEPEKKATTTATKEEPKVESKEEKQGQVVNKEEIKPKTVQQEDSKPKKLDARTISSLLKDKKFEDAIAVGKSFPELKDVAESISRYVEHINSNISSEEYVRHNYSIYTMLKNIVNDSDYNRFNLKFRYVINTICIANKDKKVNELTFLRYDYKWQWGGAEYARYSKLITIIFTACEIGIKEVQKLFNIDRVTDLFTEAGRNNLKKFF